jgi:two-component system, LuxR family, sensor kinase FixL
VIGFSTDISSRKSTEASNRQLAEELAHILRLGIAGEMASALAHEINQPLAVIANYSRGAIRAVRQSEFPPERALEVLQTISEQAFAAANIVSRWKEFISKGEPHLSLIELSALLAEIVSFASPYASSRNATVVLKPMEEKVFVHVDRVQIQQVVLNLLANAFDAIELLKEDRRVVTVSAEIHFDGVAVCVSDCGIGMSPEMISRAFEPYFTTKPKGLGMGLSVSRTLVEAQGGRLTAQPNLSCGVTVTMFLPIVPKEFP